MSLKVFLCWQVVPLLNVKRSPISKQDGQKKKIHSCHFDKNKILSQKEGLEIIYTNKPVAWRKLAETEGIQPIIRLFCKYRDFRCKSSRHVM